MNAILFRIYAVDDAIKHKAVPLARIDRDIYHLWTLRVPRAFSGGI
jgi:hypothetical protein